MASAIENPDSQTKHQHNVLKPSLETISVYASQQGLSHRTLKQLLNVITVPKFLDQASQSALVKCLYPNGKVHSDVVYTVVGSLGHGTLKASLPAQQGLIKWLIMVYDHLEDPMVLSSMYSLFFNLLDTFSLREDLCCLLAKMTRKKHVKPFRLQVLRNLSRIAGQEPALLKLMSVYDKYTPGQLELGRTKKRLSSFEHPDPGWGEHLERIQRMASLHTPEDVVQRNTDDPFGHHVEQLPANISENHSHRQEYMDDFINSLSEPPLTKITIADLQDPLFPKRAVLQPTDATMKVVSELLSSSLQQHLDETERTDKDDSALSNILEKAFTFTRYTKTLPESLIAFFSAYLPTWDGQTSQSTILSLLTYLPLKPFEDLYPTLLQPLERTLRPMPIESSTTPTTSTTTSTPSLLLHFYTTLLTHWTTHLLAFPPLTLLQTSALTDLTTHLTHLPLTLLTSTSPTTQSTTNTILTYYTTLLPLLAPPFSIPLAPPLPETTALLLLGHPTLPTLNQLASILAAYKTIYEKMNGNGEGKEVPARPAAHVKMLNASLIDTLNLLLRSRAFNNTDPHSQGFLLPPHVIAALSTYTSSLAPPQPLTGLFTLSAYPALVGLSITALREIEDAAEERNDGVDGMSMGEGMVRHAGPVTQRSLVELGRGGGVKVDWKEYRVAVLRWLEGMGASGLRELGEATMKGLMGGQTGAKT